MAMAFGKISTPLDNGIKGRRNKKISRPHRPWRDFARADGVR
jgi:hypothetical protein